LLAAHKARHFFATEDANAQLVFSTSAGQIMGDVLSVGASVGLRIAVHDPDGESVDRIELWRGQVGAGVLSSPAITWNGSAAADHVEAPPAGDYYYFARVVQADGHDLWSAPMWITFTGSGGCSDTTAPAVNVTSPAVGATVGCGDVTVAAAASDAGGVAAVEVQLDAGPWSAASFNPGSGRWEVLWDASASTSGPHTLRARATDASCNANVGTSAPVSVTVDNSGCSAGPVDVSGWTLTQANSSATWIAPPGTQIPAGGALIVARDTTRSAFEAFWGPLPANAVFLSSGGALPLINGSETYSLSDGTTTVDGPTIAMSSSGGQSLQRLDLCGGAGLASSWSVLASSAGTPGDSAAPSCGAGVRISEISDALGTGNYVYEFVELRADVAAAPDTTAPEVTISSPAAGANLAGTVSLGADASDAVGVTGVELLVDGVVVATLSSPPWSFAWNSTDVANGSHQVGARAFDAAGNQGHATPVSVTVTNDLTPPTTAITTPGAGSVVAGTTLVTASASDDVGVTQVEFLLDGGVVATDTSAPYNWNWNTTTTPDGVHELRSRAFDASGKTTISATVSVTVSNAPPGFDISGWSLSQTSSTLTYQVPAGTLVPTGGYVIIARNADRAAFEAYWGVQLGANVVFVNSGNRMPQINGSEAYTLRSVGGTTIDGATVKMASTGGRSVRRTNPCGAANRSSSWTNGTPSTANPGSGAAAGCGRGMVINEFSDTTGTGTYVYEFVELHHDS
jgi:hypothetical protein